MNALRSFFRTLPRFWRLRRLMLADDGAAAAEYALLLAAMATGVVIAMLGLSGAVSGSIGANASAVAAAQSGDRPTPTRTFGALSVQVAPSTPHAFPEAGPPADRPPGVGPLV